MNEKAVTIQLRRGTEQSEYRLPYQDGMNALSALKTIYEDFDRTIAYPMCLCRVGRCGACAMRINGKAVLGCNARLEAGEHYCLTDIAIREGYSANVKFSPVKNILEGDPYCQSLSVYRDITKKGQ